MKIYIQVDDSTFDTRKRRDIKLKKIFDEKIEIDLGSKSKPMLGELDLGNNTRNVVSLEHVTHICEKLVYKNDKFYIKVQVLDTPQGKSLKNILKSIPTDRFRMSEIYDEFKDETITFNVKINQVNWN